MEDHALERHLVSEVPASCGSWRGCGRRALSLRLLERFVPAGPPAGLGFNSRPGRLRLGGWEAFRCVPTEKLTCWPCAIQQDSSWLSPGTQDAFPGPPSVALAPSGVWPCRGSPMWRELRHCSPWMPATLGPILMWLGQHL